MRQGFLFSILLTGICLFSALAIAAPATYIISGIVETAEGVGVEGVDVVPDGGITPTVTAVDGSYSIVVSNHWDGTVTVSKAGWLITPTSKSYTNVVTDLPNQDYLAVYDWSANLGTGELENPYQISNTEQLMAIGSDSVLLRKCFILVNDIVFDPNNPAHVLAHALIAPDVNEEDYHYNGTPFSGVFDGNGHAITNLKIIAPDHSYTGIFGCVSTGGQVKNLYVKNVYIQTYNYTGAIAGNNYGTIISCHSDGLVDGYTFVGGLAGVSQGLNGSSSNFAHVEKR